MHQKLPDVNQTCWQLASIQLTGVLSLPILATSVIISQTSGLVDSIITLILGNALLWVIRYFIIIMSYKERKSTLDISLDYVGKVGGYFVAIFLLLSSVFWYIEQTTLASNALIFLVPIHENAEISKFIQYSVLLGIISTLLCMDGIVIIRWLCVVLLPLLGVAFVCTLFFSSTPALDFKDNGMYFAGLPLVLGTNLGVTADLPTFFRHAKSKMACIHALTIIQLISLALSIAGIFLGTVIKPWFGVSQEQFTGSYNTLLRISLSALVFFSVVCANVANVYSASVGWEIIAPVLAGRKEYLILGLGLSAVYILTGDLFSTSSFLDAADSGLVNLCIVLILGYFVSKAFPTKLYEHWVYFIGWLLATLLNILQSFKVILPNISLTIAGPAVIILIICIGLAGRLILNRASTSA